MGVRRLGRVQTGAILATTVGAALFACASSVPSTAELSAPEAGTSPRQPFPAPPEESSLDGGSPGGGDAGDDGGCGPLCPTPIVSGQLRWDLVTGIGELGIAESDAVYLPLGKNQIDTVRVTWAPAGDLMVHPDSAPMAVSPSALFYVGKYLYAWPKPSGPYAALPGTWPCATAGGTACAWSYSRVWYEAAQNRLVWTALQGTNCNSAACTQFRLVIGTLPTSGGAPSIVAGLAPTTSPALPPLGAAFDGTDVYAFEPIGSGTHLVRVDLSTGAITAVSPDGPTWNAWIAVDDAYAYYCSTPSGTVPSILRAPKSGGSFEVAITTPEGCRDFLVDSTSYYWGTGGVDAAGRWKVLRAPKTQGAASSVMLMTPPCFGYGRLVAQNASSVFVVGADTMPCSCASPPCAYCPSLCAYVGMQSK